MKILMKNIMPDILSYLCYMFQYEQRATKRDMTYMKKLSRQEIMHYVKEKDFTPIDAYFAM